MRNLIISTVIVIAAVFGINHFLSNNNNKFKEVEYDPNDWITTNHTFFTTNIGGYIDIEKFSSWEILPENIQLKPIAKYKGYIIVDLPDGRRGLVAAATLSGLKKYDIIDRSWHMSSIIDRAYVPYFDSAKMVRVDGDNMQYIGVLNFQNFYYALAKYNRGKALPPNATHIHPLILFTSQDKYYAVEANLVETDFANRLPYYNDMYRQYVDEEELKTLSYDAIIEKYGDPISISYEMDGAKRLFFRHLSNHNSIYYEGTYIIYKEGESYVETPSQSESRGRAVKKYDITPIVRRYIGWEWTQIPFAYWFAKDFCFNIQPILTEKEPFYLTPAMKGAAALIVMFILAFTSHYFFAFALFDLKFLGETALHIIVGVISIPLMILFGVVCLGYVNSWMLAIVFFTLLFSFMPLLSFSSFMEFHRCPYCRKSYCVTYTRDLIGTSIRHRTKTEFGQNVELKDPYSGPDRVVDAENPEDFKHNNERDTTDFEDEILLRKTTDHYLYYFHCNKCNSNWQKNMKESNEKEVGRDRIITGRKKERVVD